jgi:hypothetical protein
MLEGRIQTAHFARVADLTDAATLSRVLRPVKSVERTQIAPLVHSGATHERLDVALEQGDRVALILKHSRPSQDWAEVSVDSSTTSCKSSNTTSSGCCAAMLFRSCTRL